jgi:hypothetical protein
LGSQGSRKASRIAVHGRIARVTGAYFTMRFLPAFPAKFLASLRAHRGKTSAQQKRRGSQEPRPETLQLSTINSSNHQLRCTLSAPNPPPGRSRGRADCPRRWLAPSPVTWRGQQQPRPESFQKRSRYSAYPPNVMVTISLSTPISWSCNTPRPMYSRFSATPACASGLLSKYGDNVSIATLRQVAVPRSRE